jgi:hypothetical protein
MDPLYTVQVHQKDCKKTVRGGEGRGGSKGKKTSESIGRSDEGNGSFESEHQVRIQTSGFESVHLGWHRDHWIQTHTMGCSSNPVKVQTLTSGFDYRLPEILNSIPEFLVRIHSSVSSNSKV